MAVVHNYPYLLTGTNTAPILYFQGEREEREEREEIRSTKNIILKIV